MSQTYNSNIQGFSNDKLNHHYKPFENHGPHHNNSHNNNSHHNNSHHSNSHHNSINSHSNNSHHNNSHNKHHNNYHNNHHNNHHKKVVYCHNCGKNGHLNKKCRNPILSYGIILFYPHSLNGLLTSDNFRGKVAQHLSSNNNLSGRSVPMKPPPGLSSIPYSLKAELDSFIEQEKMDIHKTELKYLMILDRHTPDYVQIILGSYDFEDYTYLKTLVSRLTKTEIQLIMTYDLNYLFVKYWIFSKKNALKLYKKQYHHSKKIFKELKEGTTNSKGEFIKFSELVEEFARDGKGWNESDWGFPKGRRKRNGFESDIECAIREFKEETGIDPSQYQIQKNIKPIEEEFQGSNGITYKHVYYVAQAKNYLPIYLNPYNSLQVSEIQKIGWYTHDQGVKMIRDYHGERKSLFNKMHHYLTQQ